MNKEKTKDSISNFFNDDKPDKIKERKEEFEIIDYEKIVNDIYKQILNITPDITLIKKYSNQLKFKIITKEKLESILKGEIKCSNLDSCFQLTYCMMGGNKIHEIKPYLETILPYIDRLIYIDSFSIDGSPEYIKELLLDNPTKIILIQKEWKDKFSEFRNHYLNYLKEINYNGYVIVSDTDEHFPIESLKKIRELIPKIEKDRYTGISVQVEDISVDDYDINKILSRHINEYWKSLIFKYSPELQYKGEPHETLVGHKINWYRSDIIYQHIRSNLHILTRAVENFFISNSNRYSEKWAEFRFICTKYELNTFKDFWKLFEVHNLPKEIEDWIVLHKDDNSDTGDSEVREMYILYNNILKSHTVQNSVNITYSNPIECTSDISKRTSIYSISHHTCLNCFMHKPLIELSLNNYKIIMCKECFLSLAKYIKKECEDIK